MMNEKDQEIPILECRDLVKKYAVMPVLSGLNLTLGRGKIIGLLGPNGCGKTTLIKLINGLLVPTAGEIKVGGMSPGIETKKIVSYLPERTYLSEWMTAGDTLSFFQDFYEDFDRAKAEDMLKRLKILTTDRFRAMSKGTREKLQLVLVMSRKAQLYVLDEPIGGVDPAAREYILKTIISNYSENATVLISTHLIADIEQVLDEFVFLSAGQAAMHASVDEIRENQGKSVDALFREVFQC